MSTKSFDILYLCGTGWSWWAEHRPALLLQGQGLFGMSVLLPAGRERAASLPAEIGRSV